MGWRGIAGAGGRRRRAGFTLIEVAIGVVVVGIGLMASMQFMGAASKATGVNTQTMLAVQYARAGWETAYGQGFAKVKDWTANPPTAAPALSTPSPGFERHIWVENVNINSIAGAAAGGEISDKLRVNVDICKGGKVIYTQRWILTKS